MKTKSSNHRAQNTFKFQTFHERLASISIDAARKFSKFSSTPEDADTFFAEALKKWTDFNYTQDFINFRKEISSDVQNLAQLVHHQNEIVQTLQKHLRVPNSMALAPLLDLVVQMARDLQADFYPFFEEFFHTLVWLLNSYHHEVEILEQTFTCLAYLFKFLWRNMAKNVQTIFNLFCPLLGDQYKDYIHTFAGESFAFLMRKDKDHNALFDFMFLNLKANPDRVQGVGRLLFDMVKGVKHQFHSSTEKVLPILLSKVASSKLPKHEVEETLLAMFQAMAEHTSKEHGEVVWKVLLSDIAVVDNDLNVTKGKKTDVKNHRLETELHLLLIWIQYKHGSIVCHQDLLVQTLCSLLKNTNLSEYSADLLQQNISSLLRGEKCALDPQHRPKLIASFFKGSLPTQLVFDFCQSVFDIAMFEKDLLPGLLRYCHSCLQLPDPEKHGAVLCVITQLLQHQNPPTVDVADPESTTVYPLDFSPIIGKRAKNELTFPQWLTKQLEGEINTENKRCLPMMWASVVCLPHVRPLPTEQCFPLLVEISKNLMTSLTAEDSADSKISDQRLCLLSESLSTLYTLYEEKTQFYKDITPALVVKMLKAFPNVVTCLKLADLYFTGAKLHADQCLSEEIFTDIFSFLQHNLSSSCSRIRLLTLHIFCQFDLQMTPLPDDMQPDFDQLGVFQICLEAELTAVSVQTIREKLKHLRKLSHDIVHYQLPVGPFALVPLQYLIGMLFVNFRLIWEPVIELIATHAKGLPRDQFWSLFEKLLDKAASNTERGLQEKNEVKNISPVDSSDDASDLESQDDLGDLLTFHIEQMTKSDRSDHVNFRYHLWKAMTLFPEVCEPRSRIVSPLLFRFLDNEYYPSNVTMAPTQDITKRSHNDDQDDEDENLDQSQDAIEVDPDDDQSELDNSNRKSDKNTSNSETVIGQSPTKNISGRTDVSEKNKYGNRKKKNKPHRATNKSLLIHLELFAKFKNPRSLHSEPRLQKLYHELLQHVDPAVQKMTFNCVMTYKHKYLTPYRENFDHLFDDKAFKNELTLFSMDESVTVVDKDHRENLVPVLLRILYGKMQHKTGKDTSGKALSHVRKGIVLRFIGGCRQQEIKIFLDLVFEPFKDFMEGSIVEKVNDIMTTADPSCSIPLKRLQGVLNTIDLVLSKLGSLLEGYLGDILQLLLCIGSLCTGLLDHRDHIGNNPLGLLKTIRNAVVTRVNQFFNKFDFYTFTEEELEAVFNVTVWPQIEKLPADGIHNPTPLMRLLDSWTHLNKYFPLLRRAHPINAEGTPLLYVFQLLRAKSVKKSVVTMVLDMIERLLVAEDPVVLDEEEQAMVVDAEKTEDLPDGMKLLLPHVSAILSYLKSVAKKLSGTGGKKKVVPARELQILSRLSKYVTDGPQSADIIHLLLPFLGRRISRSEDVEVDVLNSVTNLVHRVEQPAKFLPQLSSLFSVLSSRRSRTALCSVLQAVAEHAPELQELTDIVTNLNSWDSRRVEEPDYMARLHAFEEANKFLQRSPGGDMILMLVHNCSYFLSTTEDMSLRDSSSFYLQKLTENLASLPKKDELFQLVVLQNLLPEVKDKLKHKSEVVRHEFINVLAYLVRNFPGDPAFSDLAKLTNEDVEMDFFNNITHIQQHRRARALRRVIKLLSTSSIKTSTLVYYLLPITTMFIKDPIYAKAQNLHDAAVDTHGAICRQLPWPRYLIVLKYYLAQLPKSLDNQKLIVRLVVTILDAFHFDLQNSEGVKAALVKDTKKDLVAEEIEEAEPDEKTRDPEDDADQTEEDVDILEEEDEDAKDGISDEETEAPVGVQSAPGAPQICPAGLASRIHRLIVRTIIPRLHKSLTQKAKSDDEHRKAGASKYAEDEEILRVPLALAMVKLLQNLPKGTLEQNLSGVLLKVCVFLRSRSRDIRESSRDTLAKILQSLGAAYFFYIVKELKSSLTRGYQLHVLCYTVWSLLKNLTSAGLKTGELDSSIGLLVQIFNGELFGTMSEEKEVEAIVGKLFEAKTSKSYDSYGILAKYVSQGCLAKIVVPLKEVLESTTSHKKARKVSDILHKVSLGLVENEGLPLTALTSFVYGITNELLPQLNALKEKPSDKQEKKEEATGFRPPDTHLLPHTPKRGGVKPVTHIKSNMHIIVDFGLQVLYLMLKKSMLVSTVKEHLELIDPLVPTLKECLPSKYVKITTTSLRCLAWVLRFPLPSLRDHIEPINNHLFVLLNNYATAGAAHGDNFELMVMCFKTMTVLVRDVKYHTISQQQLQVLLQYAEQDIHDFTRQATAFTLLKAILSRKLVVPEMEEVMRKIRQLSIVSETPHVRLQCRQVIMQYLLDYPLGRKLQRHLEFYVRQLEYAQESGRESSLEMLAKIFSDFPQKILTDYSGLFFLPLTTCLVNDESAKCKKLTSLAIKSLLNRLDIGERDKLISMCMTWLRDEKATVRKLSALAVGLLVEVESTSFERHLGTILPLLEEQIHPDNFPEESESDVVTKDKDHLLYTMLSLLLKLSRECDVLRKDDWSEPVNKILGHLESHLLYPHTWVRLCSAQIFGLLFASWTPLQLVETSRECIKNQNAAQSPSGKKKKAKHDEAKTNENVHKNENRYLVGNFNEKLHTLCGQFYKQLASPRIEQDLADQVIKNLVFLAKVLKLLPDKRLATLESTQKDDVTAKTDDITIHDASTGDDDSTKTASLSWLVVRMCREARIETSLNPKKIIKRSSVFKWIAAVSLDLGKDHISPYLPTLLRPVVREMSDQSSIQDASLRQLSQEVLDLVKTTVGMEKFTKTYASIMNTLADRRDSRKRQRALEAVSDPELTAKRKIKKHLAKKEAKKRKMVEKRPEKKPKKQKLSDMAMIDY